jgi:hypothetical protein
VVAESAQGLSCSQAKVAIGIAKNRQKHTNGQLLPLLEIRRIAWRRLFRGWPPPQVIW